MAPRLSTHAGVAPVMLAMLASGGFAMLSALVFLSPFVVSPYAQQNDVYMGNLFLAPPLFVIGSLLYIGGLAGLGLSPSLVVLLALVNLIVITPFWQFFLGTSVISIRTYPYLAAANTVMLLVAGLLIARRFGHVVAWEQGVVLALTGSAILALAYALFGGRYVSFGESRVNWPPYLNESMMGLAAGLAVTVFVIGWVWGRVTEQRRAPAR